MQRGVTDGDMKRFHLDLSKFEVGRLGKLGKPGRWEATCNTFEHERGELIAGEDWI